MSPTGIRGIRIEVEKVGTWKSCPCGSARSTWMAGGAGTNSDTGNQTWAAGKCWHRDLCSGPQEMLLSLAGESNGEWMQGTGFGVQCLGADSHSAPSQKGGTEQRRNLSLGGPGSQGLTLCPRSHLSPPMRILQCCRSTPGSPLPTAPPQISPLGAGCGEGGDGEDGGAESQETEHKPGWGREGAPGGGVPRQGELEKGCPGELPRAG